MKAKRVFHHDDPPCKARLDGSGYCQKCKVVADFQSIVLVPYCTSCQIPLHKDLDCPKCEQVFE